MIYLNQILKIPFSGEPIQIPIIGTDVIIELKCT